MKCELKQCNFEHDGSFGSGRFCSLKCSRAFSTSEKRKQINQKVSDTFSKNSVSLNYLYDSGLITRTDIENAVLDSKSWREVLRKLNVKFSGTSIHVLKKVTADWNLDVEHFVKPRLTEDWLSVRPGELKGKLAIHLKKIGRKYECESCGLGSTWKDKPITLQVDHINGINYDHRPENLRFLCPNCHSQTDTFCWKNIKK